MGIAILVGVSPAIAESKKKKPAPAKQVKKEAPPPPLEEAEEVPVDPMEGLPHIKGPKLVSLNAEIEIDLPEGAYLVEREKAQEMVRLGGGDAEGVIGALLQPDKDWFVLIEYAPVGYVTDTDAKDLDASALLASYKTATLAQNPKRKSLGVPELFVDTWSEAPRYDRSQRVLVWGLNAHTAEGPVINFFTRVLGRGGFISVNLIDAPATIDASKAETAPLRNAIHFKTGFKYEDYREGDKSSGMGLTALVLGGGALAAKKAGVLAGLLLVFKKAFVFIALGIAGFFRWLFGKKKKGEGEMPPPSDPAPTNT